MDNTLASTAGMAGTGMALGGPVGAGIGAGVGLLSGIFGNAAQEHKMKMEAAMRAAEQRAAPYLAKVGAKNGADTQVDFATNGAGNLLQGALGGLQTAGNISKASQENELRQLMLQKLQGNNPALASQQSQALNGMGGLYDDATLAQLASMQGAG